MDQDETWGSLQQIIQEDENQNNVRQGDIIYLKSYLPDDNKGLISGEGFAANKLECLLLQKSSNDYYNSNEFLANKQIDSLVNKQAEWNIFKCLFRILDSNRSIYEQAKSEIVSDEQKGNEEQNESEKNIIYGQEIQLLHLYSKCFLTLNSQVLAKENCCRELRLEQSITSNSNFMLSSNTKSYGEPVLFGDILYLKSSVVHLNKWGLGIQQTSPYSEVHASQIASTLRICNYAENENENVIMNGDIIVFKNRLLGGYLSIKRQFSSTKLMQQRQIYKKKDQPLEQNSINLSELRKQENLDQMFHITLESELQLNSLWQLIGLTSQSAQLQNNKKEKSRVQKSYLIKNVLTGTFLYLENEQLHASYDRLQQKFEFQIRNLQKTEQQINLGEFYRILRIQENQQLSQFQTYAIQCNNFNEVNITTNCQKTQYDQQLFKVARGPYQDAMAANKIQSFYFGIVEFYIFLQDWALDRELKYQYNIAFQNQKQLQDEINQFEKLLQNMNLFLTQENSIQETKQCQFNLCQYDVLDLLIKLQQLVNLISTQENKWESSFSDKTAQRIARQKFDPVASIKKKKQFNLIEEIYSTIYQIILDNYDCCNYVIQEDSIIDFLFSQLNQFREQIEKMFKQIVSKAKYNPIIAKKWINRISMITEENLEDQMFIITIINLFISSNYHISVECQNLCRKNLFSNNKCKLIKCLIINEIPVIQLEADAKTFEKNNKRFCDNHHDHYQNLKQNQIALEYFMKHDQLRQYHIYEQYLLNLLNLYAKMCRGRNFKNMNLIKNVAGINQQFFDSIIKSKHSLQCKQVIIELFSSLYLDIDPLTKISIFENTCYLRQALGDFDKELESGRYFYENISSNILKQTDSYQNFQQDTVRTQENMKELLLLKSFSSHIITNQKYHEYFINLFLQQEYPTILTEDSNSSLKYKEISKVQIRFFLSVIRIIKDSIDLGYNTLNKNREIQETLPNIFFVLIIQLNNNFKTFEFQEDNAFNLNLKNMQYTKSKLISEQFEKFNLKFNQSWISDFLLWTTSTCNDQDLIEQIFQEALNIYQVLFYLSANLQVLQYVTQKESSLNELFASHNSILFHCLFGTMKLPNLNNEILQYLILSFNNQQYDLQEIKEVEILDDEIERKYFGIVNGHYEAQGDQGPKEIQQYVKQAVKYVQIDQQNNKKIDEFQKSFLKISQYIQKINSLFESIRNYNQSYTKSLQNMIRNAGIHLIFIEFFISSDEIIEDEHVVYFYRSFLKFWENFIKDNQTNFQILMPQLDHLLKIILLPQPQRDNFLYKSLQISKLQLQSASHSIIDIIMNISKSLNLNENLIHIRAGKQYLKILQRFTKTASKPKFNHLSNQKQILHLILQNFRNLIDPLQYFEDKIQKDKQVQSSVLRYYQLKLHSAALNLISETCQNYYLGISETQRILLFEQLTSVLQNEPYIVKGAYLKCIFELYVNFAKSNNLIGDLIDNYQLKELFTSVIIPDLQLMQQFQKSHNLGNSILLNNKEYWKYILYVFEFLISVIDEFRLLERQNECNFIEEYTQILTLIKGILLNTSNPLIQEKREYIQQISEIIELFLKNLYDFNLQNRLQIFCIRQKMSLQDLIDHVEQLNQRDRVLKLKEICNQNHKTYIKQEDLIGFRTNKVSQYQSSENWIDFKKAFHTQNEFNEITTQAQDRLREELNLQILKEDFQKKKEEEIKKLFVKKKCQGEIQNPLSEDVQILFFLHDLSQQANGLLQDDKFKEFIIKCKQIFSQYPQYLIKLCKIFLEMKKPAKTYINQGELDDDDDDIKENENKQGQLNTLEQYTIYQNVISENDIHVIAIEQLNHQNPNEQLDSLTLLHLLLDFGNTQVQQRFYTLLQNHKKHKKIFIQFFRDFYSTDVSIKLEELSTSKNSDYLNICIKVLQVLQGLCENVHIEFQKFLRIQNQQDSITNNFNFVLETTNLLVNFLSDKSVENSKKWDLYQQGLLSLIEFSTGLNENKKEITKNSRLFSGFNELFDHSDLDTALIPSSKKVQNVYFQLLQTLYIYIQLLISLLEGNANENKQVYKFLLENLNNEFLMSLAKKIYNCRIFPKKSVICVDKYCKLPCYDNLCNKSFCVNGYKTREDSLLIETGLNIFIIGLKLSNYSNDQKFKIFQFESMTIEKDLIQEDQLYQDISLRNVIEKTFSISQHPEYYQKVVDTQLVNNDLFDEVNEEKQNTSAKLVQVSREDEFFLFYREFIGRIEVVNQFGQIERILFQKPFVCKYMTENIKLNLIYESNRETDEDRITSFLENIGFYHSQMAHYQNVSTIPIMHFGQKHWRTLKDVSYILCVVIVLFFILMPDNIADGNLVEGDNEEDEIITDSKKVQVVLYLNNIITVIQLILNLIIIIFCAIERYPIAVNFRRGETNVKQIQNLKIEAGFKIPEYKKKYYEFVGYMENNFEQQQVRKNPLRKIIVLLLIDFDNLYNLIIFGITAIAFFNNYVYAILLLDIVKRSEVLQNIIKAFTENTKNLLIFGLLGLIGLVLYGFLIKISFSGDFKDETKFAQDSLGYSIAHVINFGLRNGGGIGDTLSDYADPFEEPAKYWKRYFFDLTFFIIFNILFLQMIFGIIVDKFGELRDERQELLKDIQGKCFICSLERNEIDSKTKNGWYQHIYLEHNVYHMLFYLIYIKKKPITECNQLEKYIKDQMENKLSEFLPVKLTYELQNQQKQQQQ
ncbi:unnamed protein product (macronuclear) [Paramecium tetraurelia]|uniref:MIR domain protein n=1 Tax=Paramecium tetraurelia TaxID=5888 RepID=A0EDH7_PARTE|nr:uncharacterized protein GSPATT00004213001 [Paramecium tetraurelia]CAK93344.1 unnamed protein product [Paramecium tetraurelia]|eukprot:XP_001460741.1 hypothetical protein (macronuclear) [Paramecium tetraurelia strain d4-2]